MSPMRNFWPMVLAVAAVAIASGGGWLLVIALCLVVAALRLCAEDEFKRGYVKACDDAMQDNRDRFKDWLDDLEADYEQRRDRG